MSPGDITLSIAHFLRLRRMPPVNGIFLKHVTFSGKSLFDYAQKIFCTAWFTDTDDIALGQFFVG